MSPALIGGIAGGAAALVAVGVAVALKAKKGKTPSGSSGRIGGGDFAELDY
jgi:hypothetical protein